ncbi:MAG TPA: HAD hydrolase-like protein [Candidatus Paceibacterota bacterium]|nr:HAD hydrolase-like protein [Candidatus Paceibacterota bacterium]
MENKKLVLFDFDGVIADTFHVAHGVAQKVCAYLTESEYRKRFDGNIFEKFFFDEDHGDECDHDLDWWAHYVPSFYKHAREFSDVVELLPDLSTRYLLLIVSSTRGDLIKHFLKQHKLEQAIEGVWGAEVNPKKNEKIEEICSNYDVEPKQCVFVTDTLGDINEAAGVGVRSIAVTWGFQDRETLLRGEPVKIVDRPQELPHAISDYFALVHESAAEK